MVTIKSLLVVAGLVASFAAGAYAQGFPNIRSAQGNLREAMARLERAPNVFGGHKAEAMQLIRAAYDELDLGMEFAAERRQYGR